MRLLTLLEAINQDTLSGGAGILVFIPRTGRILVQIRGEHPDDKDSGKYDLFGGTLEEGETAEECARREAKEEGDLDFPEDGLEEIGAFSSTENGDWDGEPYHVFLSVQQQEFPVKIDNDEVAKAGWVEPDVITDENATNRLVKVLQHEKLAATLHERLTEQQERLPNSPSYYTHKFPFWALRGDNRRFVYNPNNGAIVIGTRDPVKSDDFGSHAQEFSASGAPGHFDDYWIRGWIGIGGKYKYGVIHFAPPIRKQDFEGNPELYRAALSSIDMFKRSGAAGSTKIRNFIDMSERPLSSLTEAHHRNLSEGKKDQYYQMFSGITDLLAGLGSKDVGTEVRSRIDKVIRTMGREDRILWALRIFKKMFLMELRKLSDKKVSHVDDDDWPWTSGMERQLQKLSNIQLHDIPDFMATEFGKDIRNALEKLGYVDKMDLPRGRGRTKERNAILKKNNEIVAQHWDNMDLFRHSSYAGLDQILNDIGHYIGVGEAHTDVEPNNPVVSYRFEGKPYSQVKRELARLTKPLEKKWKAGDVAQGEVFLEISPEWRWELLSRTCRKEAKALGHCGGVSDPNIGPSDRLLSLREIRSIEGTDRKRSFAHLTFVIDTATGVLSQMRGQANTKPKVQYHEFIIPLLMDKRVTGFKPVNYKPEGNFHLSDLNPQQINQIVSAKPNLLASLDPNGKKAVMLKIGKKMPRQPSPAAQQARQQPQSPYPQAPGVTEAEQPGSYAYWYNIRNGKFDMFIRDEDEMEHHFDRVMDNPQFFGITKKEFSQVEDTSDLVMILAAKGWTRMNAHFDRGYIDAASQKEAKRGMDWLTSRHPNLRKITVEVVGPSGKRTIKTINRAPVHEAAYPYHGYEMPGDWYHGMSSSSRAFVRKKGTHPSDVGIWLTNNKNIAVQFSQQASRRMVDDIPILVTAKTYAQNPMVFDTYREYLEAWREVGDSQKLRQRLMRKGHDSILIAKSDTDFGGEPRMDLAVFKPSEIRVVSKDKLEKPPRE